MAVRICPGCHEISKKLKIACVRICNYGEKRKSRFFFLSMLLFTLIIPLTVGAQTSKISGSKKDQTPHPIFKKNPDGSSILTWYDKAKKPKAKLEVINAENSIFINTPIAKLTIFKDHNNIYAYLPKIGTPDNEPIVTLKDTSGNILWQSFQDKNMVLKSEEDKELTRLSGMRVVKFFDTIGREVVGFQDYSGEKFKPKSRYGHYFLIFVNLRNSDESSAIVDTDKNKGTVSVTLIEAENTVREWLNGLPKEIPGLQLLDKNDKVLWETK